MNDFYKKAENLLCSWLKNYSDLFKPTYPESEFINSLLHRVNKVFKENGVIVDLGGGISIVNGVLSQLGMDVFVVDQLDDYFVYSSMKKDGLLQIDFLEDKGVKFIKANLEEYNLLNQFNKNSIDRITSFHALEHLHHSPRKLLENSIEVMKDDGFILIEVPNAVNLLKRIKVFFGKTNYLSYNKYYFSEKYVLHIREYTVGDLRQLADNLGFNNYKIYGRNWYGTLYSKVRSKFLAKALDNMLQIFPSLCGSLFIKLDKKDSIITNI
jgi:SAM-dependent methyltransferase